MKPSDKIQEIMDELGNDPDYIERKTDSLYQIEKKLDALIQYMDNQWKNDIIHTLVVNNEVQKKTYPKAFCSGCWNLMQPKGDGTYYCKECDGKQDNTITKRPDC